MGKPKEETLHLKISAEMKDRLVEVADHRDISTSQLVREAIQEKVEQFDLSTRMSHESAEVPA